MYVLKEIVMKKSTAILLFIALIGSAVIFSSCSKKEKAIAGAVIGAGAGIGIGSAIGNTEGGVAGGLVGGAAGALIGHSLGKDKKKKNDQGTK